MTSRKRKRAAANADDLRARARELLPIPTLISPRTREEILERAVRPLGPAATLPPRTAAASAAGPDHRFHASLLTALWRVRAKLLDPVTGELLAELSPELRKIGLHFRMAWSILAEAGFEVLDHTGEPVPEGGVYGLRVLSVREEPGCTGSVVRETWKPTVRYRGSTLQPGEVVVARPPEPSGDGESGPGTGAG
jgi:hypothetical protein